MKKYWYRLKLAINDWKGDQTWQALIDSGFGRLAILEKTGEEKKEISINITDDLKQLKLYWIEIILSSLIATFGLLQNSAAVIIGAMLIAPLMQPIQGMAFAVATGRPRLFWRSTRILAMSIGLSIGLAYLVCLIAPFKTETAEMIGRTAPNLFDLFIAICSAVVAFLAHGFKKLSESVAGVAMAASLMPPLAVVGIEICFGAMDKAWGSFLLFFTNLVAILLVGAILFIFYGFNPHQEQTTQTLKRLGTIILIILVLWIPLLSGLTGIKEKREIEAYTQEVLANTLSSLIPQAQVKRLSVDAYTESYISISGEIKLPDNISLFTEIIDDMNQQISEKLDREVELNFDIIRTASVLSKKEVDSKNDNIKKRTRSIIQKNYPSVIILSLEVLDVSTEQQPNQLSIKSVYALPSGEVVDEASQKRIESEIRSGFVDSTLKFLWFPVSQRTITKAPESLKVHSPSEEEVVSSQLEQRWGHFLAQQEGDRINFDNLNISWSYIEPVIVLPTVLEEDKQEEVITPENTENSSPVEEELSTNIFEGILSGGKTEEEVVEVPRLKQIQIRFDVYVDAASPTSFELFETTLAEFKESFAPDLVEVQYRVFNYQLSTLTEPVVPKVKEELPLGEAIIVEEDEIDS